MTEQVKRLEENWVKMYSGLIKEDERFVIHGDLWGNNIMVNDKTNKAKILDWQTLCPGHPILDLIFLLCTNVTIENIGRLNF